MRRCSFGRARVPCHAHLGGRRRRMPIVGMDALDARRRVCRHGPGIANGIAGQHGEVSSRGVAQCLQNQRKPSAIAVGMLRDVFPRKDPLRPSSAAAQMRHVSLVRLRPLKACS